ncbi:MAG TPA: Sec-independent protein translocase subunit TatA [Micrococcaceae bacterium]|nr:Sec-independent protein translocase subunit TatA [Micrococcaceae bacterium]
MGKLFDSPVAIIIIVVVIVLLFAAPKLPGMARSLGQSMRIIKSEVKEMKNDGKTENAAPSNSAGNANQTAEPPVEGRIVNNPHQSGTPQSGARGAGDGTTPGTGNPS